MNLSKIWLIAKREFLTNFRRKAFLFTAFGMPLFIGVVMFVVFSLVSNVVDDTSAYKRVGVVDLANILTGATLEQPFVAYSSVEAASTDMQSKTLDGYYVIPADYMTGAKVDAFYFQSKAFNDGLNGKLSDIIKKALSAQIGDETLAARLKDPFDKLNIYRVGNPTKLEESALTAIFLVPVFLSVFVFILIMSTSQYLVLGLGEEKENRMMELFITSSRPTEMLWGKLIGLGALGLFLVLVWAVFSLIFALARGADIGQTLANLQLTPGFLLLMMVYVMLGYLVYGSLMAGLGASANAEQEARQLSSVVSLIGTVPLFFMFAFISDPNGGLATFLSMFPLTAPVSMIVRLAFAPVPSSQIVLSLGLMIVTVIAVMWFSARLFRLGMLNYGKRFSVRDLLRALAPGRQQYISPAKTREVAS